MDDFERAILFSFDQSGAVGVQLKAQAQAFCLAARNVPLSQLLPACLDRLCSSTHSEVQFWCLQTLEELVRGPGSPQSQPRRGTACDPSASSMGREEQAFLREGLLACVFQPVSPEATKSAAGAGFLLPVDRCVLWPGFIRNKAAQVLALLMRADALTSLAERGALGEGGRDEGPPIHVWAAPVDVAVDRLQAVSAAASVAPASPPPPLSCGWPWSTWTWHAGCSWRWMRRW